MAFKRRVYFLITFLLIQLSSYSQKPIELQFKYLPFNLLNPTMPHLTLGLEAKYKKKIGVEFDYGRRIFDRGIYDFIDYKLSGKNSSPIPFDSLITPSTGERFHYELKYYKERLFFGLAFYSVTDTRNIAILYSIPDSLNSTLSYSRFENTAIKKRVLLFNFICGFNYHYKRFSIENDVLVGIKHKKQDYIQNESHRLGYNSFHHFIWDQPMNRYRPSFNIGVKLAYRIL